MMLNRVNTMRDTLFYKGAAFRWQTACLHSGDEPHRLLEDFVKTRIQSLSFLATLAVVVGMISSGGILNAQSTSSTPSDQPSSQSQQSTPDTPPTQQPPDTTPAPTPSTPSAQQPSQDAPSSQQPSQSEPAPDQGKAQTGTSDAQTFSGTVVKSGDKYVLQEDSGKTYDIDHQDDVKKFEGKKVRVQGTLDASGKKILVK